MKTEDKQSLEEIEVILESFAFHMVGLQNQGLKLSHVTVPKWWKDNKHNFISPTEDKVVDAEGFYNENLYGLKDLINDDDIEAFYKDLIISGLNQFAQSQN